MIVKLNLTPEEIFVLRGFFDTAITNNRLDDGTHYGMTKAETKRCDRALRHVIDCLESAIPIPVPKRSRT